MVHNNMNAIISVFATNSVHHYQNKQTSNNEGDQKTDKKHLPL